ncbi:branched-chain amino acid ABC transporter permease/ATP-binding protein [Gordonia insulae]|uniref:Lipopolysaccharide export system ATP-binding protein LptB n=1 Tax=Gordonia insulae TaxID=2420509 RepID=A0A3G8JL65_9ACTN|nr:branched-chain amino acid ABC transporter permease/ATP-binding protein [Gordonia insulae]AZG45385.1 Lipopolysaccharide export system ATP-binding protein LptB [Gordonia insulae]
MSDHLAFLILGLGAGAVFAALGMSLVVTFRSSGVVNFATGALALYIAYTFAFLRKGELLVPIPGFPQTITLSSQPLTFVSAAAISLVIAAAVGLILYLLVFRWLRTSSPVAKAVASIGVMLVVQLVLAMRVGTSPVSVEPILSQEIYTVSGVRIPADRVWFALIIIVLALALGALIKYTRFGLATRAVAETERGAIVSGLSPNRVAAINWALSVVVAGVSGILIAPIVPLVPLSYTLFIVPALAAAMVGGFTKVGPTVAAGLIIGMVQGELIYLQNTIDWFPAGGVAELTTLVLILVLLVVRRNQLPQRGTLSSLSLGRAPRPRNLVTPTIIAVTIGLVALFATSGGTRGAVITTIVLAIIGLSQVVVTGFAGQVSLAQLTLAGTSAFVVSRLTTVLGVPFPFAPILAALVATVIGVVIGLPALRLRGLPVAVLTLAMAVTLEAFWFRNTDFNGGAAGAPVENPTMFGLDFGIGSGDSYPRITFGILCLVVAVFVGLGVAFLRRSRLGASMLAVRANERSAAASGIAVNRVKIIAFAIGSFIAGLGGALMAYQQNVASAASYSALAGIALFATAYLAGISSIGGGVLSGVIGVGGILYFALDKWVNLGDYFAVITGVLLIVSVIVNPDGIVGPVHALITRIRHRPNGSVDLDLSVDPTSISEAPALGTEVLSAEAVGMRYGGVIALEDVSFSVRSGEILGLIGPNGAGKTTLIDALSGFANSTGSVVLDGERLDGLAPHERSRRGLGRTFQGIELYDDLTVRENVLVGTEAAKHRGEDDPDLERLFEILHLTPVADRMVAELSQGQRQLVSIARALAGRPKALMLDEPAAGLDSSESMWLGQRLRAVRGAGTTVVMVDHDMGLVLDLCDRIVVLDLGRVIAIGTPDEIKQNPEVIRAYLGSSAPPEEAALEEPALAQAQEVTA